MVFLENILIRKTLIAGLVAIALLLSGQAMAIKPQKPNDPVVVECVEKGLLLVGRLLDVQAKFENYELLKNNYTFKQQQEMAREILADYDKTVAEHGFLNKRCCEKYKIKNYQTTWPELYESWECNRFDNLSK